MIVKDRWKGVANVNGVATIVNEGKDLLAFHWSPG